MRRLILDTNSLSYLVRAGGPQALKLLENRAASNGEHLVVTDVVRREISQGPQAGVIDQWLREAKVEIISTPEGEKFFEFLDTGKVTSDRAYSTRNAGDRSIAYVAGSGKTAGIQDTIFSEDSFFSNPQVMRSYNLTGRERLGIADLLNERLQSGSISTSEYQNLVDGFRKITPYDPTKRWSGYSERLDRFLPPEVLAQFDSGSASIYTSRIAQYASNALSAIGIAAMAFDISVTTDEAQRLAHMGRTDEAGQAMARLAGRIYGGFEGAAFGAALTASGGPLAIVGALAGGVVGALVGDQAEALIWNARNQALDYLKSSVLPVQTRQKAFALNGTVMQTLIQRGLTPGSASGILGLLEVEYNRRLASNPSLEPTDMVRDIALDTYKNQRVTPVEGDLLINVLKAGPLSRMSVEGGPNFVTSQFDGATGQTKNYCVLSGDTLLSKSVINSDGSFARTMYRAGEKPLTSSLSDSNGALLEIRGYNSSGLANVTTYDATTQLRKETTEYVGPTKRAIQKYESNGDSKRIIFDIATGLVNAEFEYTKNLERRSETTYDKSGARRRTEFDPTSGRALRELDYSATGQLVVEKQFNESGSRSETTFDVKGVAVTVEQFNAQRQRTSRVDINPDGSRTQLQFSPTDGSVSRRIDYDAKNAVVYDSRVEEQKAAARKAELERQAAQAAAAAEAQRKAQEAAAAAEAQRKAQEAAAAAEAQRKAQEAAEAQWKAQEAAAAAEAQRKAQAAAAAAAAEATARANAELVARMRADQERRNAEMAEQARIRQQQIDAQNKKIAEEAAAREQKQREEFAKQRAYEEWVAKNQNLHSHNPVIHAPVPTPSPIVSPSRPKATPSRPAGGRGGYGVPIVLDMDGDGQIGIAPLAGEQEGSGIDAVAGVSTPRFDWDGDGAADETAWTTKGDGLLVIDVASDGTQGPDGQVTFAGEIAFALWKTEGERQEETQSSGGDAPTAGVSDLDGLRYAFDTNGDGRLDAQDERWSEFRIWQDANQNARVDESEMITLDRAGISLIDLLGQTSGARTFADGSSVVATTTALRTDGTTLLVGDVAFAYRASNSQSS